MGEDLTSLKRAKEWINPASSSNLTTDDELLRRLISASSRFILGQLLRPTLRLKTYTLNLQGSGTSSMMLPYFPVIDVLSLQVGTTTVQPSVSGSTGFLLDAWDGYPPGTMQMLHWRGGCFPNYPQSVAVTFRSGYFVPNEEQVAADAVQVNEVLGEWLADEGVTMNGVAMLCVVSAPSVGQYSLAPEPGGYIFNSADWGQNVLIPYSIVPSDLAHACREIIAERYSYKDRVGQTSKVIGAETISFSLKDMPAWVTTALQPYKRVVSL